MKRSSRTVPAALPVRVCRVLAGCVAAALAFAATSACAQAREVHAATCGGDVRAHWHGGPFFEYRRAVGAAPAGASAEARLHTFWAFRPFYSRVRTPEAAVDDVLWPLVTRHRVQNHLWWRAFLLAYGDVRTGAADAWSFQVLPLAFGGRDRAGAGYGGLFPFYGTHPHFLLMENWQFALWPLWMKYDVAATPHRAVLWPLVTWQANETGTMGVWPLVSHARRRAADHWYALWPLATWACYDEDRDTSGAGYSWMFWPCYGTVARARETQHLVLPPFFSYARTPHAVRWRLPWPLVDIEYGSARRRISVWPLYEKIDGRAMGSRAPDEETVRIFWKIFEYTRLVTDGTEETRWSFWPFWTQERRAVRTPEGTWRTAATFRRLWPFWRARTEEGRRHAQALDLLPIRHTDGLARNWAPFWTFWTASAEPGARVQHALFWHLVTWFSD